MRRYLDLREESSGIEIVLARFVDDPNHPELLRFAVDKRHIDLATFQGCAIAIVVHADDVTGAPLRRTRATRGCA
jgi:hypothetical protein